MINLRIEELNDRGAHFRIVGDAYKFKSTAEKEMKMIQDAIRLLECKEILSDD